MFLLRFWVFVFIKLWLLRTLLCLSKKLYLFEITVFWTALILWVKFPLFCFIRFILSFEIIVSNLLILLWILFTILDFPAPLYNKVLVVFISLLLGFLEKNSFAKKKLFSLGDIPCSTLSLLLASTEVLKAGLFSSFFIFFWNWKLFLFLLRLRNWTFLWIY